MINILAATQIRRKFGKELSGCIKLLPEIIRQHTMLTEPVYLCSKDSISAHKYPAKKEC